MNICMINNFYYIRGGSERMMFEEKRILEENGHQVFAFSQAHPNNEHSEYANYFPPYTTNYENMPLLKRILSSINIVYSRKAGRAFLRFLEESGPDLVHAHNIYGGLTTSILDAANGEGIPVVMSVYDCKLVCPSCLMLNKGRICYDCKGGKFYRCILNRCHKDSLAASAVYCFESYINKWFKKYSKVRYFFCESHFMMNNLLEAGFDKGKLIFLPNFVSTSSYRPSYGKKSFTLFVSRLSTEKGVLTLLKAMKGLSVPLRIVGAGPIKKDAEEFVSRESMNNVIFEGYVSNEKLRELYRNAAFIVTPSECNENSPISILEAFSFGKPVIGSRVGGIPELIEPGRTGMLFEAGSADQLHECVKALWSNKPMISEMGRNAHHKVKSEFSPEVHYEKLMEVYRSAVNSN